jgi:branched-chain amino acid transport system substrate-binding protein
MRIPVKVLCLAAAIAPLFACGSRPDRVVLGIGLTANTHAAMVLAVKEINDSGGIGGVPIVLDGLGTSGSQQSFEAPAVLALANQFAANHELLAVVGHSDSSSTLSAAAVYNAQQVPQIVTIATNPAITGIGQWTYRLCLSDAAQGPALAEYAVSTWKKRRIAVFFVNDAYGNGLAELFERRALELGAELVASIMHRNLLRPDDHETIRMALARMRATVQPDLIVLFQRVEAAAWTIRAIREAGLTVDVLGGDNLAQNELIRAGQDLAEGVRVSQFLNVDAANTRAQAFRATFRAATGGEPDYSQAFGYDAVYLFRDAVQKGGYTRAGVKAYLDGLIRDGTEIAGIGGQFSLKANHDARRPLYIAEVRGGVFQVIDSVTLK